MKILHLSLIVVAFALASIMTTPIQQAFAYGSITFVTPNDGDTLQGKKLVVIAKVDGLIPDEGFQTQFLIQNTNVPDDRLANSITTSTKTPFTYGFTFVKNIDADNPNGTIVILVDTDELDGSATYQVSISVSSLTDPQNRANTTITITLP